MRFEDFETIQKSVATMINTISKENTLSKNLMNVVVTRE